MSEEQVPYGDPQPPRKVKYVVVLIGGTEVPVIAPADLGLAHARMANPFHAVSAGFAYVDNWEAHGESETLQLKARPERDSELLRKYFSTGRAAA
jgi:hypothetical protein